MSPTYFVFGSLAVTSRPIRSGAFAASGRRKCRLIRGARPVSAWRGGRRQPGGRPGPRRSSASRRSWNGRWRGWCTAASRRSGAGDRRRTGSGSPACLPGGIPGRLAQDLAFLLQLADLVAQSGVLRLQRCRRLGGDLCSASPRPARASCPDPVAQGLGVDPPDRQRPVGSSPRAATGTARPRQP